MSSRKVTIKMFIYLLLGALVFFGSILVTLYINQRSLVYFPNPHSQNRSAFGAEDMEVIKARTEDDLKLEAWYKEPENGKLVLVVFHGNASHMGMSEWKVRDFIKQGYGALLPAYRGYAGNPGKPTEKGLYMDARAFIGWLINEKGIPENRIVLYGESLGSGIAVEIAAKYYKDVRAVILESPYTSFVDLAGRHYPFVPFRSVLVKDKYQSLNKIKNVKAPLLVLQGKRDMIVPYKQGERLFAAANEPKELIALPMAGHNDLYMHGAGQRVLHFLSGL